MSEKRFTLMENISAYDGRVISEYVLDNGKRLTFEEVVDLLNSLVDENEQLRQDLHIEQTDCKNQKESKEYWRNKTKEFTYYFNCLEKAIEKTFDSDDQCFEEIWKHYDEMEKKWEYD